MSNDLISRNALLDCLRGNVLIDVTSELEKAVQEQATAYDTDAVINQITRASRPGAPEYYLDGRPVIYKEMAIKIISAGGRQQNE